VTYLTPLVLYGIALLVRVGLIVLHADPAYPDSSYYVEVARNLASGRGFSVDFLWTFIEVGGRIPADPHLPVPSNPHWAPLASIVQVPFLMVFGVDNIGASLLPFVLVGALAAPLTWAIARDAGASSTVQVMAGLLGAIPALVTPFLAQADNFPLTMVLGASVLWLSSRGLKGHGRSFALAGLLVGLATLARTDGLLLAAAPLVAFLWDRWRARGERRRAKAAAGKAVAAVEHVPELGGAQRAAKTDATWARGAVSGRPVVPPGAQEGIAAAAVARVGGPPAAFRSGQPRISGRAAAASFGLFLLVVVPWEARQVLTFGSLLPSGPAGILWLKSFAELNSVTADRSLAAFLAQPAAALLGSRLRGFLDAILVAGTLILGLILVPFVLIGGGLRRRSLDFGPFFVYAAVLFAAAGLVFAIHVPNGMFLHAGVALAPHAYVLAMEGVAALAAWLAPKQERWVAEPLGQVLMVALVIIVALSALVASLNVATGWDATARERRDLAAALRAAGAAPGDRLMAADSASYKYFTGRGGVVTPDDPLRTIEQAARAYDIRWLVLERDGAVEALAPLLGNVGWPSWIGPAVYALPGAGRVGSGRGETKPRPGDYRAAIFPICFQPGDTRCAHGTSQ